jgi:hypothetical protein
MQISSTAAYPSGLWGSGGEALVGLGSVCLFVLVIAKDYGGKKTKYWPLHFVGWFTRY